MFQISETADLAGEVNNVFLVILAICVTLLLFITFLLVFFVIKYNSKRNVKPVNIKGNVPLEIIWTVVPIFLVLGIFYYGWVVYRTMRDVPKDAMNVNVTARMWSWSFKYENGVQTDTLYIPVAKPVKISLNALDVTHSFYVPAFRVKQDAVPGMETYLWFQPQVLGSYDVLCAEYCGERHSYMMSKVVVMNENDFNEWYSQKGEESNKSVNPDTTKTQKKSDLSLEGKKLVQSKGCTACHTMDGSKSVGPTFKGLYGHTVAVISAGKEKTVVADEGYLKRSILDPHVELVKGYGPLMPEEKDFLKDDEISAIIAYIEELK